jgi:hypothetical protein
MKASTLNNLDEIGIDIKTEGEDKLPLVQHVKVLNSPQVSANRE